MKGQTIGQTQFIVMRRPCLMEDEGRHFFIEAFRSKVKAQEWIAKQRGEYFTSEDYYIVEDSK